MDENETTNEAEALDTEVTVVYIEVVLTETYYSLSNTFYGFDLGGSE